MKLRIVLERPKKELLDRLKEINPKVKGITITPDEIAIEVKEELSAEEVEEIKAVLRTEYNLEIE